MLRTTNIFLIIIGSLLVIGFCAIYSSGFALSVGMNSDNMIVNHCAYVFISISAFYIASIIDYHKYRKFATPLIVLSGLMLIAVLIPGISREIYGARRWIMIFGVSIQPTELAKIASVLYLAHVLCKKQDQLAYFWKGFVGAFLVVGLIIVLIGIEPDLGNAILLSSTVLLMMQISGFQWKYFSFLAPVAVIMMIGMLAKFDHIMNRINGFLNPEELKASSGYQAYMAVTSIGSGGLTGVGLGEGQIKLHYLPFVNNDFIASLIGEEAGLVGMSVVILLFIGLLFFGLKIAINAKDLFGTLIAFGIIFMAGFQAVFHIGVNLSILPTKGISLPFVSYGGTSLIVLMASMGIVYNIGLQGRPKVEAHELGAKEVPYRIVSVRKKAEVPTT
jgi:cell division protein FtsW